MSQENKQSVEMATAQLQDKMYRLGYEDAKSNKEFGESLKQASNRLTQDGQEVEQLTLF